MDNYVFDKLKDRDFFIFPKELDKECTIQEFHNMMTENNSDIPIEKVTFTEYPQNIGL